jgi:hypothetical protein
MKKFLSIVSLCAAAVIALGFAAPAAKATTITAVFTGTVRNGQDAGGTFGGLSGGEDYTLTAFFKAPPGTYSSADGGSITGGGTATLTINGQSHVFSLSVASLGINNFGSVILDMDDGSGHANEYLSMSFWSPTLPASILTAFDGDVAPGYGGGSFQVVPGWSSGALNAGHLTVSATPIPAALPLLATALGGLGFVGWRRKAAATA